MTPSATTTATPPESCSSQQTLLTRSTPPSPSSPPTLETWASPLTSSWPSPTRAGVCPREAPVRFSRPRARQRHVSHGPQPCCDTHTQRVRDTAYDILERAVI